MPVSRSGQYELQSLLSAHPPFEVWRARHPLTGATCLLKLLKQDGSPESKAASDLVIAAVNRHAMIRNRRIITARRLASHNGNLVVEYPFLEGGDWRPVTPTLLAQHWYQLIGQIALAVDYLHLRGLVHGDLKLENFLVTEVDGRYDLRMIDLDFLQLDNSKPQGILFGTPGHIAPEVTANDRIVAQSDCYSLGVSLRRLLEPIDGQPIALPFDKSALAALVSDLTVEDYVMRPRFLSDALHQHGLLLPDKAPRSQYQLLAMIVGGLMTSRTRRALRSGQFSRFMAADLHLFGLPGELLNATSTAAGVSLSKTLRVWRSWIAGCPLGRQAEFFHLSPSDQQLFDALDALDRIVGQQEAPVRSTTAEDVLQSATRYLQKGEPMRGLRQLRGLLDEVSELPLSDGISPAKILERAAECAAEANRHSEAAKFYEAAAQSVSGPEHLFYLGEALQSVGRAMDLAEVKRLIARIKTGPGFQANDAIGLLVNRIQAFVDQNEGRLEEAEALLVKTIAEAERQGLHDALTLATYTYAVVAWRRGDFPTAEARLERTLAFCRQFQLPHRSTPALSVISQICLDSSDYVRSVLYGSATRRQAKRSRLPITLSATSASLVGSYARMAKSAKARFWLQQLLRDCQSGPGQQPATLHYSLKAFAEMQEGKLDAAKLSAGQVVALAGENDLRTPMKARLNLGEIHLWQGKLDLARTHLEQSMMVAERINDSGIVSESRLFLECLKSDFTEATGQNIQSLVVELAAVRSYYRAATGIFLLLYHDYPLTDQIKEIVAQIHKRRGARRVPLFAALSVLVVQTDTAQSGDSAIALGWKRAYQILSNANQFWLAMLAAQRIASYYLQAGSHKRGKNYLLQALRHSQTLGNRAVATHLEEQIAELERQSGSERSWIDSLLTVSGLMKDLGSYHQLLDRLLRFAVDQTGAERGIIFLRRVDRPGLQPAAAYNCDEQSVKELGDFSATIPLNTISQATPLFIDNALLDSRTSRYQSVVAHNIMSVACIPLIHGDAAIGVLYLDHHALPSLFGSEDQKLMAAIANLLVVTIAKAKDLRATSERANQLQTDLGKFGVSSRLITRDPRMLSLLQMLPKVARSSTSILIVGESGTGKEVLCDQIHRESLRAKETFIKLNCAGLASTLIESELFGIGKGVATGVAERPGKFEVADEGTMFLDEIADMPLDIQAKVLRVIEYQQFERVGTARSINVNIRFIFATHQDLDRLVAEGKFREDLYHRISRVVIEIPPLRERRTDIPLLIEHFLSLFSADKLPPRISPEAYEILIAHPWPGNVRQLRSTIEALCLFYPGEEVAPAQLPAKILRDRSTEPAPPEVIDLAERERFEDAMKKCKNNQSKAAALLNMSLTTFRRKLKKYGLDHL